MSSAQPEMLVEFNPDRSGVLYIPMQFKPGSLPDPTIFRNAQMFTNPLISTPPTASLSSALLFRPPATEVNSSSGVISMLINAQNGYPLADNANLNKDSQSQGTASNLILEHRIATRNSQLQEVVPVMWNDLGFSGIKRGSDKRKIDSQIHSKKQKLGRDKNNPVIRSNGVQSSETLKPGTKLGDRGMSGIVKSTMAKDPHKVVRRIMPETKEKPYQSPFQELPSEKTKLPIPELQIPVPKTLGTDIDNPLPSPAWLKLGIPPSPFQECLSELNMPLQEAWDALQVSAGNWNEYPTQSLLVIRLHLLATLWHHITSPEDPPEILVAPIVCAQAIALFEALLQRYGCEVLKSISKCGMKQVRRRGSKSKYKRDKSKVMRRVFTFRLRFERGGQVAAGVWNEVLKVGESMGLIDLKRDEVALNLLAEKWEQKKGAMREQERVMEIKASQRAESTGHGEMLLSKNSASLCEGPDSIGKGSVCGSNNSTRPSQLFPPVTPPTTTSKPERVRPTPSSFTSFAPTGPAGTDTARTRDLRIVTKNQSIPHGPSRAMTSQSGQREFFGLEPEARAIAPLGWRPGTLGKTPEAALLASTASDPSGRLTVASRRKTNVPQSQKEDLSAQSLKRVFPRDNGSQGSFALRETVEVKRSSTNCLLVETRRREPSSSGVSGMGIRESDVPKDGEVVASKSPVNVARTTAIPVNDRSEVVASTPRSSLPSQKGAWSTVNKISSPKPPSSPNQPPLLCPESSMKTPELADAAECRLAELKSRILQARPSPLRARATGHFEGEIPGEDDHWGRLNYEKRSQKVDLSELEVFFRNFVKE